MESSQNWTLQKAVLSGMFGVLVWLIQLAMSATFVAAIGPFMGAPIMFLVTPYLLVLFRRIVSARGSLLLMGLIMSVLFFPIPALGPAGFLPKILIIFLYVSSFELSMFYIWSKKHLIGATLGGGIGNIIVTVLMFTFFKLFNIPGSEALLNNIYIFIVIAFVGGCIGGYLGQKTYNRLKTRPIIKRLQNAQDDTM